MRRRASPLRVTVLPDADTPLWLPTRVTLAGWVFSESV